MTPLSGPTSSAGERKWHDDHAYLGRDPLPTSPYVSTEYFERERDRVFRKVWLNVAREEELPRAGDFLVFDLPIAKTSLLIVRDEKGVIRAYHNICSHRGNKLVWSDTGHARRLICKAHGWAYGLDGSLKVIQDEGNFFCVSKGANGLTAVAADVWQGFIFINLDPQPRTSLREYLGQWALDMEGYPFAELSQTRFAWRVEVNANWKAVKDGFQEAYHAAFLHQRTLPDHFRGEDNPLGLGTAYHLGERTGGFSALGNLQHRIQAVEQLAIRYAAGASRGFAVGAGGAGGAPEAAQSLPKGVNRSGHPAWVLDVNFIFPNLFVDVGAGSWFGYRMWPLSVDRTLWEIFQYAPAARNAGERFAQEYNKIALRDPLFEDARMAEQTHGVLQSGAKPQMHLQDHEILIRHDRRLLESYVGPELPVMPGSEAAARD